MRVVPVLKYHIIRLEVKLGLQGRHFQVIRSSDGNRGDHKIHGTVTSHISLKPGGSVGTHCL
jgi:hypothetical protein